jgi:hypothetical protein
MRERGVGETEFRKPRPCRGLELLRRQTSYAPLACEYAFPLLRRVLGTYAQERKS